MYQAIDWVIPELPRDKPRYLMGVGKPEQIIQTVKRGMDMFDCVVPTREARHGKLYVWRSSKRLSGKFYSEIHIKQSKFRLDTKPIDQNCDCYTCQNFSRAYLRHLFLSQESLALRLATIHNLRFYVQLMQKIREAIKLNKL